MGPTFGGGIGPGNRTSGGQIPRDSERNNLNRSAKQDDDLVFGGDD